MDFLVKVKSISYKRMGERLWSFKLYRLAYISCPRWEKFIPASDPTSIYRGSISSHFKMELTLLFIPLGCREI